MSSASDQSGFTLTELLVVLAIMALVISAVPPLYRAAIPGARLKGASVELVTFLRDARLEALRTGAPVTMTITGRTISSEAMGDSAFEAPSGVGVSYEPAFAAGMDAEELTFFPDGGSSGGTVTLGRGEAERSLAINWLTGYVAVTP